MSQPSSVGAEAARMPSAEVRGFLSLVLFIHFFVLVLALVAYPKPSPLQERLMNFVGIYLRVLNIDPTAAAYGTPRWFLTHGLPTDVDFTVAVDVRRPDGSEIKSAVQLPPPGVWGQRRLRYQALANALGSLANNETVPDTMEALLPKAIGGSAVLSNEGASGAIRSDAHYLVEMSDRIAVDPTKRDPFHSSRYAAVFDAQILVNGQNVDLLKASAKGEAAPVTKGPTGN